MAKVVRARVEVALEDGVLLVPRPDTWMGGLARHTMLTRTTGLRSHVVSADRWQEARRLRRTLVVYDDGSWAFED